MTADRLAALVLFAVAVQYVRIARTYRGLTVADVVGPSAYPILLGGLMALLAVVLFIQSKPAAGGEPFWTRHGRPILLLVSLFAYVAALEPVGFLLTTCAYLTLCMVWLGERSWLRAVGLGAALTIALWFVFDRTLSLRLPAGLLGFSP
jgi:putative tricarboxylic transport membrane protein